jgi:hypothetical protein
LRTSVLLGSRRLRVHNINKGRGKLEQGIVQHRERMRVIELLEIDRNGVKECDGDMSKGISETGKEDLNINRKRYC